MSYTAQPWPPIETDPPVIHEKAPIPGTKLQPHYTECFGCGDEQPGGLRMDTEVADSYVIKSTFAVTREHQGAPGLAHGGLLACAFDEALGTAVGQLLRMPAVTGKLETDFRQPVPVGSTLYIHARVDGMSGRKIYASASGHLDAEDGPIAVNARALFVTVGIEHFSAHGDADAMDKLRQSEQKANQRQRWDINP